MYNNTNFYREIWALQNIHVFTCLYLERNQVETNQYMYILTFREGPGPSQKVSVFSELLLERDLSLKKVNTCTKLLFREGPGPSQKVSIFISVLIRCMKYVFRKIKNIKEAFQKMWRIRLEISVN